MRVRLQLTKQGDLRYISQLDLVRMVERAIRMSGLPIAYSEGYNPRPRVAYSPALPVGVSSDTEFIDVWLESRRDPRAVAHRLNEVLPRGARVVAAGEVLLSAPSLSAVISDAEYRAMVNLTDCESGQDLALRVENYGRQDDCVTFVELKGNLLVIGLMVPAGSRSGPRPRDVVSQVLSDLGINISPERVEVHRCRLLVGGREGMPRPLAV